MVGSRNKDAQGQDGKEGSWCMPSAWQGEKKGRTTIKREERCLYHQLNQSHIVKTAQFFFLFLYQ